MMITLFNHSSQNELKPFFEHNVLNVWNFLKQLVLDHGELAYPSGMDWTLNQFEHVSYIAWLSAYYKIQEAQPLQSKIADQILYRQQLNGDGRFIGESTKNGFYTEAIQALGMAMAYLHNAVLGFPHMSENKTISPSLNHYPDVGLIVQRSAQNIFTISYGRQSMVLNYPLKNTKSNQVYYVSPNINSLLSSSKETKLVEFKQTDKGLRAELRIQTRKGYVARVIVDHEPDATMIVEVPSEESQRPNDWMIAAIENDEMSGGKRQVIATRGINIVQGKSGKKISSLPGNWINVDNWYGYVNVLGDHFSWRGAQEYNRPGAAHDSLMLVSKGNAPLGVIMLPGKSTEETKKVAFSLRSGNIDGLVKVQFRSPSGRNRIVNIDNRKPKLPTTIKLNKVSEDYITALLRFEPWAESVWKDYAPIPGSGYFGDGINGGNGGIRGTSNITLAYATLVRALPNDRKNAHRLERIKASLRYITATHISGPRGAVAVNGEKWGVDSTVALTDHVGWQTSMWTGFMGLGAAIIEKQLDSKLINDCKRVIATEADWRSRIEPPSRYKLNSAGEETGWQSNVLSLAASWLSDDPRATVWMKAAKKYLVNTYSVPADSSGKLKEWVSTQTLFPSYAMENHGFYHPAYQKDGGQSLGDSYLMAKLTNRNAADELRPFAENNVLNVWNFIKGILLECGDFAYPSGLDWTLHQFEHLPYISWMANHYGQKEAQAIEPVMAKQILYRQQINGDGRFIGESCPDGFYVEALQAEMLAMAFLQNEEAGFPEHKGADFENHLTHYDDVGLILFRNDNSLVTVSYGSMPMALVYPKVESGPRDQFLISPNTKSFIGVKKKGKTTLNSFTRSADGFFTSLHIKDSVRSSTMNIHSTPYYTVFVEMADSNATLPARWSLMNIENHPLTGGVRDVKTMDGVKQVKERSGTKYATIKGWMNIDDRIGFVSCNPGAFEYSAAKDYNRNGAAEDDISFVSSSGAAVRMVVVLPNAGGYETKRVKNTSDFSINGQNYSISFQYKNKTVEVKGAFVD